MRCDKLDAPARPGDSVKLGDESHHIGNVLDYVAADDFIEFVIGERIRYDSQIMYYIGIGFGIKIYSYCARILVAPAADIENLFAFRL